MQTQTSSSKYWFDFDCWWHRTSALKFSENRFSLSLRCIWKSFERVCRVSCFSIWKQWMSSVTANIPQPMPIQNRVCEPFFRCCEIQWNQCSAICGRGWCPQKHRTNDMQSNMCNNICEAGSTFWNNEQRMRWPLWISATKCFLCTWFYIFFLVAAQRLLCIRFE